MSVFVAAIVWLACLLVSIGFQAATYRNLNERRKRLGEAERLLVTRERRYVDSLEDMPTSLMVAFYPDEDPPTPLTVLCTFTAKLRAHRAVDAGAARTDEVADVVVAGTFLGVLDTLTEDQVTGLPLHVRRLTRAHFADQMGVPFDDTEVLHLKLNAHPRLRHQGES